MVTNFERAVSDDGIHYNQYYLEVLLYKKYEISYYYQKCLYLRYASYKWAATIDLI